MSVSIKTAREIELMRESCHLLEKVHDELAKAIRPGIQPGKSIIWVKK